MRQSRTVVARRGEWGNSYLMGTEFQLGEDEKGLQMDGGDGCMTM